MAETCARCRLAPPNVRRSASRERLCRGCFLLAFEEEVHKVCSRYGLFSQGDRVAVGVSGGKDSAALLHCLVAVNDRYNYKIEILMLAIDEGIKGYRDDSLKCVRIAQERYNKELLILSYEDLYDGWTMDEIVSVMGKKQNCSYCGILRRQALEKGAIQLGATKIATGHNADDSIETILLNCEGSKLDSNLLMLIVLRGDSRRLRSCSSAFTGSDDGEGEGALSKLQRVKPFYYSYQKEVVLYCYFAKLMYFSTECSYAPNAYRGQVRELVKAIEAKNPELIRIALHTSEFLVKQQAAAETIRAITCEGCGLATTSSTICQACALVARLNSRQFLSQ